eukprot:COSAG02_NODE_723_length_18041_cov_7.464720_9_plen_98_part_00
MIRTPFVIGVPRTHSSVDRSHWEIERTMITSSRCFDASSQWYNFPVQTAQNLKSKIPRRLNLHETVGKSRGRDQKEVAAFRLHTFDWGGRRVSSPYV